MSFKSGRRPVMPISHYFSRYFYGVTRDVNKANVRCKWAVFDFFRMMPFGPCPTPPASRLSTFLKLSAHKLLVFKWSQAQFFLKFISDMLCLCHYGPALLRFWFQPNLGRENPASCTGGEDLFLQRSRVGHALRPIFLLRLVKIWQVSSCRKFMQHL